MAKPVVFVIGASGNIGTATVSALSAKYTDKLEVRAGVRNPDKAAAEKLKELPGVTVVKAEMGNKDQLKDTLKGVDALYIIAPSTENKAELVAATAEAAKDAGVKFLLVLSVPTANLSDTIFGRQCGEIETKTSQLGVPHSFIRFPFFVDNNWGYKGSIQGQSTIFAPISPDKPFTPVVVEDAGKASALILSDYSKHSGKTYTITSDRYTHAELAGAFTEALGREIKYVQVPYEDAKKAFMGMGFYEWQADGAMELFKLIDSGSPETNQSDIGVYKRLTGEDPTSLKSWIAKNVAGFK